METSEVKKTPELVKKYWQNHRLASSACWAHSAYINPFWWFTFLVFWECSLVLEVEPIVPVSVVPSWHLPLSVHPYYWICPAWTKTVTNIKQFFQVKVWNTLMKNEHIFIILPHKGLVNPVLGTLKSLFLIISLVIKKCNEIVTL